MATSIGWPRATPADASEAAPAEGARLVLFTGAGVSYLDHNFQREDVQLFGRDPRACRRRCIRRPARLVIPCGEDCSLNVAMVCAMAVGEACGREPVISGQ
jgi:tRNA(Leu) C34 or U34 (ribose-2'-O)-methylase TrmL